MSDFSCAVSFDIDVDLAEAKLVRECVELGDELDFLTFDKDQAGTARAYEARSDRFKATFPLVDGESDPFASFRKIFDDPEYPHIGVHLNFDDEGDDEKLVSISISSKNAEIEPLANLIRATCATALPAGFVFSTYSTKNEPGAANGGFALVQADGISVAWADALLADRLKEIDPDAGEPVAQLRRTPPMMRLVQDHIRNDVTELVSELARGAKAEVLPRLTEQAQALSEIFVDHRQAAIENGWKVEDGAWRGYNWDEFPSWEKADEAGRCETLSTAVDVCRENDLSPEQYAITGFYAVSPWLAAKLSEKGERVEPAFAKLHVWARWWEASIDLVDDPVLTKIASETGRYK